MDLNVGSFVTYCLLRFTTENVQVYQGCFWHCIWHDECRLSWQTFDIDQGYAFEFIKVVSDIVLDMINAAYHGKPLIFIGTTFRKKLVSHHRAVNEADSCLHTKRSPDKNHRLVMMNGIYHVKYSVRNSLDKLERSQQFIFTAWWWETSLSRNVAPIKIKGLPW